MAQYRRGVSASSSADGWFVVLVAALWIAAIVGWIWNIVKIVGSLNEPLTAMFVARCVGAFLMPIGVILGYL